MTWFVVHLIFYKQTTSTLMKSLPFWKYSFTVELVSVLPTLSAMFVVDVCDRMKSLCQQVGILPFFNSCGSGGRAAVLQLEGSIPGSSSPHVDVSLGKTFNPKLLLLLRQRCMNVCEWVNDMWCKVLRVVTKTRKALYTVYHPFNILEIVPILSWKLQDGTPLVGTLSSCITESLG